MNKYDYTQQLQRIGKISSIGRVRFLIEELPINIREAIQDILDNRYFWTVSLGGSKWLNVVVGEGGPSVYGSYEDGRGHVFSDDWVITPKTLRKEWVWDWLLGESVRKACNLIGPSVLEHLLQGDEAEQRAIKRLLE